MISAETSAKISASLQGKFKEQSRGWKGEGASYYAKHMWILKHYGKANKCTCDQSHTAKRFEWANISGKYHRDISDYVQLCPSCHRKIDLYKTHCKNGHELINENIRISKEGWKVCKLCAKESRRRYKENAKAN